MKLSVAQPLRGTCDNKVDFENAFQASILPENDLHDIVVFLTRSPMGDKWIALGIHDMVPANGPKVSISRGRLINVEAYVDALRQVLSDYPVSAAPDAIVTDNRDELIVPVTPQTEQIAREWIANCVRLNDALKILSEATPTRENVDAVTAALKDKTLQYDLGSGHEGPSIFQLRLNALEVFKRWNLRAPPVETVLPRDRYRSAWGILIALIVVVALMIILVARSHGRRFALTGALSISSMLLLWQWIDSHWTYSDLCYRYAYWYCWASLHKGSIYLGWGTQEDPKFTNTDHVCPPAGLHFARLDSREVPVFFEKPLTVISETDWTLIWFAKANPENVPYGAKPTIRTHLRIHDSLPLLLTSSLSLLGVYHLVLRRRLRARRNLCPACGYDWRATVGKCSECGFVDSRTQSEVQS